MKERRAHIVISQHERGFWQADVYLDIESFEELRLSGQSPDGFCTRPTEAGVRAWCAEEYPGAVIVEADEDAGHD